MKHQEPHDNEMRLDQLNRRLEAVRKVNRLINRTEDSRVLLQGACDCLTETRGYFNAWIALLDSDRKLTESHDSGLGQAFLPMMAQLQSGRLTRCASRALNEKEVITTGDPAKTCTDCPLSGLYRRRCAMTVRIAHRDRVFGLLSVSIPMPRPEAKEERNLLADLAEDLGYALFSLETEKHLRLHRHITKSPALPHDHYGHRISLSNGERGLRVHLRKRPIRNRWSVPQPILFSRFFRKPHSAKSGPLPRRRGGALRDIYSTASWACTMDGDCTILRTGIRKVPLPGLFLWARILPRKSRKKTTSNSASRRAGLFIASPGSWNSAGS